MKILVQIVTKDGVPVVADLEVWYWSTGDLVRDCVASTPRPEPDEDDDSEVYAMYFSVLLCKGFPRAAQELYSTKLAALIAQRDEYAHEVERLNFEIAKELPHGT